MKLKLLPSFFQIFPSFLKKGQIYLHAQKKILWLLDWVLTTDAFYYVTMHMHICFLLFFFKLKYYKLTVLLIFVLISNICVRRILTLEMTWNENCRYGVMRMKARLNGVEPQNILFRGCRGRGEGCGGGSKVTLTCALRLRDKGWTAWRLIWCDQVVMRLENRVFMPRCRQRGRLH